MELPYHYSSEKNALLLVALLKANGIKRVIASPGTTNINFVWSVQQDPFFQVFSAVDERHAAYLACGMATATREPVVITCTGATASRNYFPGLTEAYYRKLPILAVTATQPVSRVGNLAPQMLDRSAQPHDTVVLSLQCPIPTDRDLAACELQINRALIALKRHGGGPVHLNLETRYARDFPVKELPPVRSISYTQATDTTWPTLPQGKRIAVWVGAHLPFTQAETEAIEAFVAAWDAVVLVDKTSGYQGLGHVNSSLLCSQRWTHHPELEALTPDLVIHIGEISGDYPSNGILFPTKTFWRVSPDGEARDLCGKLASVFEMPEATFFAHYAKEGTVNKTDYATAWQTQDAKARAKIPELPFSNPWIAQQLAPQLPKNSILHVAILNSLRSWNCFPVDPSIQTMSNVGGFGIDGCMSTCIGSSLVLPETPHFLVIGDLAFFYDLNALGNRHLGKNLRILLINNGAGGEFHIYNHPGYLFGEHCKDFIGADGHYGNKSRDLVRHYAEDLGLLYLSADSKETFGPAMERFLSEEGQSIVFECFTNTEDESEAHRLLNNTIPPIKDAKDHLKEALPTNVKSFLKKVLK